MVTNKPHDRSELPPSTQRLARAIEDHLPDGPSRKALLEAVRANHYHDFLGHTATPMLDLMQALRREYGRIAGASMLIALARDGEFDAEDKEIDDWAASSDGRRVLSQLGPLYSPEGN